MLRLILTVSITVENWIGNCFPNQFSQRFGWLHYNLSSGELCGPYFLCLAPACCSRRDVQGFQAIYHTLWGFKIKNPNISLCTREIGAAGDAENVTKSLYNDLAIPFLPVGWADCTSCVEEGRRAGEAGGQMGLVGWHFS